MKKKAIIFFFIIFIQVIYAVNLPGPKNDQLYTEFKSTRTSPYLKRPMSSSGYIVMNGKENFLFKQQKPVEINVRKDGEHMTLKIGNNPAVEINPDSGGDNIAFLFNNDGNLDKYYDITQSVSQGYDEYLVIPKKKSKIEKIIVQGKENIVISIILNFYDRSVITYTFKNTRTGTPPDEKYF